MIHKLMIRLFHRCLLYFKRQGHDVRVIVNDNELTFQGELKRSKK